MQSYVSYFDVYCFESSDSCELNESLNEIFTAHERKSQLLFFPLLNCPQVTKQLLLFSYFVIGVNVVVAIVFHTCSSKVFLANFNSQYMLAPVVFCMLDCRSLLPQINISTTTAVGTSCSGNASFKSFGKHLLLHIKFAPQFLKK